MPSTYYGENMVIINGVVQGNGTTHRGNGQVIEYSEEMGEFRGVEAGGTSRLTFVTADKYSIKVRVEENLRGFVEAVINSRRILCLGWKSNTSIETSKGLHIEISCPSLVALDLSGAVKVFGHVEGLRSLDVSGAVKGSLRGATERLTLDLSGAVKLDLGSLKALRVHGDISGCVKVTCHATEKAVLDVSGASHCKVAGGGRIQSDISGVGRVSVV